MFGCGVHWKINRSTSAWHVRIVVFTACVIEGIHIISIDRNSRQPLPEEHTCQTGIPNTTNPTRQRFRHHAAEDHASCCFEGRLQGINSLIYCLKDFPFSQSASNNLTHSSRSPSKTAPTQTSRSPPMRSSKSLLQPSAAATCISTVDT